MSIAVQMRGAIEFQLGLAANTTDASFDSKIPTTTEPTGDGVFNIGQTNQVVQGVQAVFFGQGGDDSTLSARLIGWKLMDDIWIPTVLAEINAVLSTVVGVASAAITNNDRLADTLTLATGFSSTNVILTSPTGNIVAHATINLDGYSKIEWSLKVGSATNANCIWAIF